MANEKRGSEMIERGRLWLLIHIDYIYIYFIRERERERESKTKIDTLAPIH